MQSVWCFFSAKKIYTGLFSMQHFCGQSAGGAGYLNTTNHARDFLNPACVVQLSDMGAG
jgi:hypothetical protein